MQAAILAHAFVLLNGDAHELAADAVLLTH
jgi:hypothetical protein